MDSASRHSTKPQKLSCTGQGSLFHPFLQRRQEVNSHLSPDASHPSSHSASGFVSAWLPSFSGSRPCLSKGEWPPYKNGVLWADFPQKPQSSSESQASTLLSVGNINSSYIKLTEFRGIYIGNIGKNLIFFTKFYIEVYMEYYLSIYGIHIDITFKKL